MAFKECSLLRFDSPDAAWLDFVAENRQGTYQGKCSSDLLAALKIRKLFNQLVFATEKSLQYLYFEGRELV